MHFSGSRTGMGTKVVLNVYDLGPTNEYLYPWGLGTYHSGLQVFGQEYTFAGGSGVFFHEVLLQIFCVLIFLILKISTAERCPWPGNLQRKH